MHISIYRYIYLHHICLYVLFKLNLLFTTHSSMLSFVFSLTVTYSFKIVKQKQFTLFKITNKVNINSLCGLPLHSKSNFIDLFLYQRIILDVVATKAKHIAKILVNDEE